MAGAAPYDNNATYTGLAMRAEQREDDLLHVVRRVCHRMGNAPLPLRSCVSHRRYPTTSTACLLASIPRRPEGCRFSCS
uniref:Uncharacterized protein n=1 Tax=Ralstonia solanacearum CFBP2957 TaxID=859656 RepID=D8P2D1_RALSL|nr:protein of unknown function [Ralstonia solanacearum CFBP2957]